MTIAELTRDLDKAIADVQAKKIEFEKFKSATELAEKAYNGAQISVSELHNKYVEYMRSILGSFGPTHK